MKDKKINSLENLSTKLSTLLSYLVEGQEKREEIQALLQENNSLLVEPGSYQIYDNTMRKNIDVHNITIFELAVYLDSEICKLMIDCVGNEEQSSKIKTQLLLTCVAMGKGDLVCKILSANPNLLLSRGDVLDPSGRTFKNITAFELMLWSLDHVYMWKRISSCIPEGEEGKEISSSLLQQLENVEKKGVTYILNGEEYTEGHYNILPLISAFEKLVVATEKERDYRFPKPCYEGYKGFVAMSQNRMPAFTSDCWFGEVVPEQILAPEHIRHLTMLRGIPEGRRITQAFPHSEYAKITEERDDSLNYRDFGGWSSLSLRQPVLRPLSEEQTRGENKISAWMPTSYYPGYVRASYTLSFCNVLHNGVFKDQISRIQDQLLYKSSRNEHGSSLKLR